MRIASQNLQRPTCRGLRLLAGPQTDSDVSEYASGVRNPHWNNTLILRLALLEHCEQPNGLEKSVLR